MSGQVARCLVTPGSSSKGTEFNGEIRLDNGNDSFFSNSPMYVWGGSGDDVLWNGPGGFSNGGFGADTIVAGTADYSQGVVRDGVNVTLDGKSNDGGWEDGPAGKRDNVIAANVAGTAGNDTIVGSASADTLDGRAGKDSLVGCAGDDFLDGAHGKDVLRDGGSRFCLEGGNDTLVGGLGSDVLLSGNGNDTVHADESDGGRDKRINCGGEFDFDVLYHDQLDASLRAPGCERRILFR